MKYLKQIVPAIAVLVIILTSSLFVPLAASAAKVPASGGGAPSTKPTSGIPTASTTQGAYQCGSGTNKITTSIDFGCVGNKCQQANCSAILDLTFSIIRFMADGGGLVVVLGLIIAGIQYTISKGDPQNRARALSRIKHVMIALFIYIFAYAILNYLIPGGFFQGGS